MKTWRYTNSNSINIIYFSNFKPTKGLEDVKSDLAYQSRARARFCISALQFASFLILAN